MTRLVAAYAVPARRLRRLLVDVGLVIDAAHNSPAGGLHAGLEPGVLERLVCRARCVVPFCEAR